MTTTCQNCRKDYDAVGLDKGRVILCPLHGAAAELRDALTELFGLIEDNVLVRNIERDHEPGWAMRQIPFVRTLARVQAVLANTEPKAEATEAVTPEAGR